jgi:hypothetical protein
MQFQKAQRKQARLRLAVTGPSGSGKTYSALLLAAGIGGKIAVIDTEHGSASLYSDMVDFATLELTPPYTPERYIEALALAAREGFDICIVDSATHEWDGSGGCLDINEQIAQAKFRGNTWSAWSETTPRHRAFIDAMLQSPMHIIATSRSKTETVQGDDKKVKKLGMKAVQRDGFEYEFTVVLDLEHSGHWAVASKDRTRLFPQPHIITAETGKRLAQWLDSGVAEQPPAQQQPPADPEMNADEAKAHLTAIQNAQDMIVLRGQWTVAQRAAKKVGDLAALKRFEEAKDKRKAELDTKAQAEADELQRHTTASDNTDIGTMQNAGDTNTLALFDESDKREAQGEAA